MNEDSKPNKPVIHIEFPAPESSEASIHIEGVNEIQLFGIAKMLEQAGIEHMARRAMQAAMQDAANGKGGIVQAPSFGDLKS